MLTAFFLICLKSFSLWREFNFLESLISGRSILGGKIRAAATTGPAQGPRPTSSTPAIWRNPFWDKSDSKKSQSLGLAFFAGLGLGRDIGLQRSFLFDFP